MVHGFEPHVGLCADSLEPGACFGFCVSLPLCSSPALTLSLSLTLSKIKIKKINNNKKSKSKMKNGKTTSFVSLSPLPPQINTVMNSIKPGRATCQKKILEYHWYFSSISYEMVRISLKSDQVIQARKVDMLISFTSSKIQKCFLRLLELIFVATFKVLKIFRILKSLPQNYHIY